MTSQARTERQRKRSPLRISLQGKIMREAKVVQAEIREEQQQHLLRAQGEDGQEEEKRELTTKPQYRKQTTNAPAPPRTQTKENGESKNHRSKKTGGGRVRQRKRGSIVEGRQRQTERQTRGAGSQAASSECLHHRDARPSDSRPGSPSTQAVPLPTTVSLQDHKLSGTRWSKRGGGWTNIIALKYTQTRQSSLDQPYQKPRQPLVSPPPPLRS